MTYSKKNRPNPAWAAAAVGMLLVTLPFVLAATWDDFRGTGFAGMLLGFFVFLLGGALVGGLAWLALKLLARLPAWLAAAAAGSSAVVFLSVFALQPRANPLYFLVFPFLAALFLGSTFALANDVWGHQVWLRRGAMSAGVLVGLVGSVGGSYWLFTDGFPVEAPINAAAVASQPPAALMLPDPGQPGPFEVLSLTYGSGEDLHRLEYGSQADLTTQPVDGSKLVSGWSPLRRSHWGFGPEAMPLNGRVWYPKTSGAERLPLVLIVHGNHIMEYASDTGYAYLGELLASQGFIAVSVDENFLNISPAADLTGFMSLQDENDARGWLLLEHLRAWQAFDQDFHAPFYHKVDFDRIALIGHSRGGEAAAIAVNFNRLPFYPDDASLAFDYGFNIRAVAAIAPIDGGYQPGGRALPLENVSYLVMHGAQDMDATSFQGRRMYQRLQFTGDGFYFKSAVYIYGANHGQFNTSWGRKDFVEPGVRLFNLDAIMDPEAQRQVAKVYLSAFLKATLNGETAYLPLFTDARAGALWLPDTIYLTQYADSRTRSLAAFEEDLDLTTATLPGAALSHTGLQHWSEGYLYGKDRSPLSTTAAFLSWEPNPADPPTFILDLPPGGAPSLRLTADSTLTLALGDASPASAPAPEPIDLTVELVDASGEMARLPLSHFSAIQPRINGRILKAPWLSRQLPSEIVLSNFELRLGDFQASNANFNPAALAQIRLVFNRTPSGSLALDDIGFR